MNTKDFLEQLRKTIRQETKYNRFFDAVVIELKEARAVCTVAALGFDTPEKAVICTYMDKNSMTDYTIGDNVIIGFRDNNPARGFILGAGNDFQNVKPKSYSFETKTEILYEDKQSLVTITKDNLLKELKIETIPGWKIVLDNGLNNITLGQTSVNINNGNHEVLI
jgi:hypothetical protein